MRENLTSSSYGEWLETGRDLTQAPRQSFTRHGLMEEGYRAHLANPSGVEQYSGLKYGDDEHEAFWLAEMLRLKILPEGFIYPKEQRPL